MATHRVTVKQGHDGQPFLFAEPLGPLLPGSSLWNIALFLKPEVSLDTAKQVAKTLNSVVESINVSTRDN